MATIGDRLREARIKRGFPSAAEAARAFGWHAQNVRDQEAGRRGTSPEQAERYAIAYSVSPDWLLWGRGAPPGKRRPGYPLIGKVGAGGMGTYDDDYSLGAASDYIEPLPGMPVEADIIALETDGDSMAPLVFDGDLAFFGPVREDVEALIGRRVMARLADGRKYFKVLKRGTVPGRYTLRSLNPATPDIDDVEVTWVLPYRGSRPR